MSKPARPSDGTSGKWGWHLGVHDFLVEPLLDAAGDLDIPLSETLPPGGDDGQVLTKDGTPDGQSVWGDPVGEPGPPGVEWEGEWDSQVEYPSRSAVRHEGSLWLADGTAAAGEEPGVAAVWVLLVAQGPQGDQVELQTSDTHIQWRYEGGTWTDLIALSELEGEKGDTGEAWDGWRGEWNSTASYEPLDTVQHQGSSWIATVANTNSEPSTANTDWNLVAKAAEFENANLDDLNDVDTSGASSGEALVYDGTSWGPGAGVPESLDDIQDVEVPTPADGESLVWNDGQARWEAAPRVDQQQLDNATYVSVKQHGATGDGTTDDTAAIQAAIDSIDDDRGGIVFFPRGDYLTTATLTIEDDGIILLGESRSATRLIADHSLGPVIRIKASYCGSVRLAVWATSARKTGSAGSNYGIQFECDDIEESTDTRTRNSVVEDCRIFDQPNHGLVMVGPGLDGSHVARCYIQANLGHGIVIDRGTTTGRTNLATTGVAGVTSVNDCVSASNSGHGLAVGHPSDPGSLPALRVIVENFDCATNADDSAVRHTDHQIYIRGNNCEVRAAGIASDGASGCIYVEGRNHWFRNNRYIDAVSSVHVGDGSEGVNVEGLTVIGATQFEAVKVDAGATNVRVLNQNPDNITALVTPRRPGTQVDRVPQVVRKDFDEKVTNSDVLIDDANLKHYLDADEEIAFTCVLQHTSGSADADLQVAFTVPSGAALRWGPANGIKVDASDAVVAQGDVVVTGDTITFGSGTSRRQLVIEGAVRNGSTAGLLQLQWAQAVAQPDVDTTVYAISSHLRVWRKPA